MSKTCLNCKYKSYSTPMAVTIGNTVHYICSNKNSIKYGWVVSNSEICNCFEESILYEQHQKQRDKKGELYR